MNDTFLHVLPILKLFYSGAKLFILVREVALLLVVVMLTYLEGPRMLQHILLVHSQEEEGLQAYKDVVQLKTKSVSG